MATRKSHANIDGLLTDAYLRESVLERVQDEIERFRRSAREAFCVPLSQAFIPFHKCHSMSDTVDAKPSTKTKFIFLKIVLAIFPALIFTQAYGWMTLYRTFGFAFLAIWALVIASVWMLDHKNHIITRILRLLEIGLFFLPIATIVMTFVLGSTLTGSTSNSLAQGAAAIGTGIGGFFVTAIAFVVGITGGIIVHLVGNNYSKKTDSEHETNPSPLNQHGVVITLTGLILITLIAPHFSPSLKDEVVAKKEVPTTTSTLAVNPSVSATSTPETPAVPPPLDISNVVISRDAINQPELDVTITNKTKKKVVALKVKALMFTKFDEPVKNSLSFDDDQSFIGIWQDGDILPSGKKDMSWSLTWYQGAGKATAELYQVKFDDGSEWKAPDFKN